MPKPVEPTLREWRIEEAFYGEEKELLDFPFRDYGSYPSSFRGGFWQTKIFSDVNSSPTNGSSQGNDMVWLLVAGRVNQVQEENQSSNTLSQLLLFESSNGGQSWRNVWKENNVPFMIEEYYDAIYSESLKKIFVVYTKEGVQGQELYWRYIDVSDGCSLSSEYPLRPNNYPVEEKIIGRKPRVSLSNNYLHVVYLDGSSLGYACVDLSNMQDVPSKQKVINNDSSLILYPDWDVVKSYPSLSISSIEEKLYVFWGSDDKVYYTHSSDEGISFATPQEVTLLSGRPSPYNGAINEVHFVSSYGLKVGLKDVVILSYSTQIEGDTYYDQQRNKTYNLYRLFLKVMVDGEWVVGSNSGRNYYAPNVMGDDREPSPREREAGVSSFFGPSVHPNFSCLYVQRVPSNLPNNDWGMEWYLLRLRYSFSHGQNKVKEYALRPNCLNQGIELDQVFYDITTIAVPNVSEPMPEDQEFIHVPHDPVRYSDLQSMEGRILDTDDEGHNDWILGEQWDNPNIMATDGRVHPARAYFSYVGAIRGQVVHAPRRKQVPYVQFARTLWRTITHGYLEDIDCKVGSASYLGYRGDRVREYQVSHGLLSYVWGVSPQENRFWMTNSSYPSQEVDKWDNVVWVKANTYDYNFLPVARDVYDSNWDVTSYFSDRHVGRFIKDLEYGSVRGVHAAQGIVISLRTPQGGEDNLEYLSSGLFPI